MKKALLILLAALICLTGAACRKKEPTETKAKTSDAAPTSSESTGISSDSTTVGEVTTTLPDPADPTPKPNETDTALFSKGDISVYFRNIALGTGTKNFQFFVTNSGDQLLNVKVRLMAVNRYATSASEDVDLIPQSAGNVTLSVWNSELRQAGVEEISEISEFAVRITVQDSRYNKIFDETITYTVDKQGE